VQFHVRLKQEFDKDVPIAELFRRSTIRELASVLDGADAADVKAIADSRGAKQRAALLRRRDARTVPHV
jgi:hypothetical protein